MNKIIFYFCLLVCLTGLKPVYSQTPDPGQQSDPQGGWKVFDRFGNEYPLVNLSTTSNKKLIGSSSQTINVATKFCTAGYFDLYYEAGSYFDGNTAAQTVMCELFSNLSGLIHSPLLTNTLTTVRVHLSNYSGTLSPVPLATAGSFYMIPVANSPLNPVPGVAESQTYKTIKSGVDAWANVPSSIFIGVSNVQYYHGMITINPSVQWYTGLGTSTLTTDYDLYTVMLHEAMHMLGFASLIDKSGASKFGNNNNYYSSYDKFLYTSSNVPLLSSSTQSTCPNGNLAFSQSTTVISPGSCPNPSPNISNCTSAVQYSSANTGTVPVYTPDCYEEGSSLSHFEDLCYAPNFTATSPCFTLAGNSNNDLYWVMSNANGTGPCFIKRYPKPKERLVLCDLGYSVTTSYTSNATAAPFSYTGGTCPGKDIWGVDDGFNGNIYTYTTTASSIGIQTTAISANDATTTVKLSCLDVIYGNASQSISSGSLVVTANTGYHGLVVIKYLPENSSGEQGNPTYVYVYFVPIGCSPSGVCNLVQNGNFESIVYGPGCNNVIPGPHNLPQSGSGSLPGCWEAYLGAPDLFERNCTNTLAPNYNLGNNVFGTSLDSYNGNPNNHIVGLEMAYKGTISMQTGLMIPPSADVLKNNLNTPLIPGHTYQLSFLASNFSGSISNPNSQPIVITIASAPVFNMPSISNFSTGLHGIAQFTIGATSSTASPWTAHTQTFVFTPTVGHSALIIGGNVGLTFPSPSSVNVAYCFLDEISIQEIPNPTFVIPNAQTCGNFSYTNLAQYATGSGTFTGANITYTASQYNFNTSNTLASGNYPIAYSSPNGTCINTVWQNVLVDIPHTVTASSNTITCANFNTTFTLTAFSNYTASPISYNWQPGSISGATVAVTETATTIYTVSATNAAGCTNITTVAVTVPTNCCFSPGLPTFTGTSISGSPIFWGPFLLPNSFTVPSGSNLWLSGEIIIAQNVSITVASGGQLIIYGAHLYACGDMWQGVKVLDGGKVLSVAYNGNENLIEDAKIAIEVSNHTPNAVNQIIDLDNIIFNKNHVSIKLADYAITSTTYAYPISLNNCVFTCRDFTFNPGSWPSATNLRSATNPTTGLTAPYTFQNAPVANLKTPYSTLPSHAGIQILNSGVTNTLNVFPSANVNVFGHTQVQVGNSGSVSDFLLFDSHEISIDVNSSNVRIENCVFQNTRTLTVSSTATAAAAIQFTSGIENKMLEITGVNQNTGCRFWDCHTAIEARDAYNLTLKNSIIRSTHSSTNPSSPTVALPGDRGLYINTNRFDDYRIEYNEFTNLTDGVSMVCAPRNFAGGIGWFEPATFSTTTYYSIVTYARDLRINNNTFCPELNTAFTGATANYVKNAITLAGPFNIWSTHSTAGLSTQNNLIYRCQNGISYSGMNSIGMVNHGDGPPKMIGTNAITLEEDNIWNAIQNGIEFANSIPAPTAYPTLTSQALQSIENNTLNVYNAPLTNTNIALVRCFGNGGVSPTMAVVPAPYLICNELKDANKGFLFEGPNQLTYWRGNDMTNLNWGMALTNSAIIGPQGTSSSSSDNQWLGSWVSFTNTYVDNNSDALNSPLFVQSGAVTNPTNNFAPNPAKSYNQPGNKTIISPTTTYVCGGGYGQKISAPLVGSGDPLTDELTYIANTQAFRYLYYCPGLGGDVGSDEREFYDDLTGSTIHIFIQIEDTLSKGYLDGAQDLLSSLDPNDFNGIEENHYAFYDLYLKYKDPDESQFTAADLTSLSTLAGLCPGTDGYGVYQARALYLMSMGRVFNAPANCGESGEARMAPRPFAPQKNDWTGSIDMFPNPATDQVTFSSPVEGDVLEITIKDISGRAIVKQELRCQSFFIKIDINLMNGAYFVTIKNSQNETITKKLLVAR